MARPGTYGERPPAPASIEEKRVCQPLRGDQEASVRSESLESESPRCVRKAWRTSADEREQVDRTRLIGWLMSSLRRWHRRDELCKEAQVLVLQYMTV